ncbi:MAG: SIMPL domain-containing protein [Candidatus Woesearchaeota archaeon]
MKKTIIAIFAVLMIALTACETRVIMEQPGVQPQNAISVQGNTEFDVAPDMAKIRFRIETQSPTAQDAQMRNREIGNAVSAALARAGVRQNEIQTADYRVERIQEWDPTGQKMVDKGFRVSNIFVVSTKNLQNVGNVLDAGIQAGANNVESLSFELSDDKQKEVKTDALRMATKNAREKAEALADGAGVRLGKVLTLSETSYYVQPFYRGDMMVKAEGMGAPEIPPTAISPQDVHISAQVSVTYEII